MFRSIRRDGHARGRGSEGGSGHGRGRGNYRSGSGGGGSEGEGGRFTFISGILGGTTVRSGIGLNFHFVGVFVFFGVCFFVVGVGLRMNLRIKVGINLKECSVKECSVKECDEGRKEKDNK